MKPLVASTEVLKFTRGESFTDRRTVNLNDINNYFGDLDLYLMDAILKGHIPDKGNVLDLGCGEGRNGIYFIRQGWNYIGVDRNRSKIQLVDYLVKSRNSINATFKVGSIEKVDYGEHYDLIICSRVLHFMENETDFRLVWDKVHRSLNPGGIVYIAMDSAMHRSLDNPIDGLYAFPDGRKSFALDKQRYAYMLNGFEEVEDLKTIVYHKKRAQSVGLLRKTI